jgi:hypothetical protein
MQIPNTFIPLPRLHCPPEFWPALGYNGAARYVAVGYEHHHDGHISAGGTASNWWALRLLLQYNHLDMLAYNFGSDEEPADTYLVIDRGVDFTQSALSGWLAPVIDASRFVAAQWPSRPALALPVDWDLLEKALQEVFSDLENLPLGELLVQQQQKLSALELALNNVI